MPKRGKPRSGSLQYWPRKRARRIYPRVHWPASKELKPSGFAGWKAGMTYVQLVDSSGRLLTKPVTVLDAPPLLICGLRIYEKTDHGLKVVGEKWSKLPKSMERKAKAGKKEPQLDIEFHDIRLLVITQPEKSGMRKIKPDLFEIAIGGDDAKKKMEYANSMLGKELTAKDIFKPGEFVDVSAVTKGHGFTGPVKRFGIRVQTRKDQQMHRHAGSIGGTTPRHIDWRVPQSGQYGFFTRTEDNKKIIAMEDDPNKVNPKGGFLGYGLVKSSILIEGSVPGHRKRLIRLRRAVRSKKTLPIELKSISLDSKQGK